MFFFFFFQAEDGIRDYKVTGVQTCALPILSRTDDPMQAIRWSHVNATFEQQVYEAGITTGINIGTVIAVVVNRVAISEVDLEHRPKALNDCPRLSPAEHFAQTRNRGIPQRMQPAIRIVH